MGPRVITLQAAYLEQKSMSDKVKTAFMRELEEAKEKLYQVLGNKSEMTQKEFIKAANEASRHAERLMKGIRSEIQ